MSDCLKLKKSNCKNCYKCIRHCPVKSIRFSDNQANIINEECILCGKCFVACPQNAKEIRNDIPSVKTLLSGDSPVYASIAPSFVANFDQASIQSMKRALELLGFAGVEETAIGATIVKKQYDFMTQKADGTVIITSCCHTVNLLIQKHYPEALPFLAPVLSPMQAHCLDIKRRVPNAKTVFIGPCISKKDEGDSSRRIVDCVLTFEELSFLLNEKQIELEKIQETNEKSRARLFPTAGGILRTMVADNPDYTYLAVDGIQNCIHTIEEILSGNIKNCFIEMSACEGSCIGGPAMNKNHRASIEDYLKVTKYAGKDDFEVKEYPSQALSKEMNSLAPRTINLSESAIKDTLLKMGKNKPEQELNCGSCGYDTCREKAKAVLLGKADLTMCLPFLKEKAESFSDNIIQNTPNAILVLNEALEVQQINAAALKLMNIKSIHDVQGSPVVRILDPAPFMEILNNGKNTYDRNVFLAEYEKYVGQTIIFEKSYHIIVCIMRDITEEENQRRKKETIKQATIEITDKVIEKQMRAVQEIASLLGETTAETKIALTKLKESLGDE